jgi:hypothetical protein
MLKAYAVQLEAEKIAKDEHITKLKNEVEAIKLEFQNKNAENDVLITENRALKQNKVEYDQKAKKMV